MKKIFVFLMLMIFTIQCFASGITATNGIAQPSTCDTDTLETSTGPAKLRAEFTPEVINLRWYNDDTRINVPTASNSCTYDTAINLPTNPTKPGYKFAGWDVIPGIPIQYIESTGTQYIDTGLTTAPGTEEIKVISDATFTNVDNSTTNSNGSKMFYSSYPGYGLQVYINQLGESSNRTYIFNQNIYKQIYQSTNYIIETITTRQYRGLKINNEPVSGINFVRSITDNRPIYTFGDPEYASIGSCVLLRLKNQKIYINSVLVRDYIPIKDASGVACMYDQVSKQIFYNAGTGNFVAGPEI